MQCFMCGTDVGNEHICPHCGANILLYKQILYLSEKFYNIGLEKAKVRDLSGAEEALKRSLSYSKYNISARNLLGLIYYETGDTVNALNEWVIVKNFDPENALADRYLAEVENTPGLLNKINTTIKKYNQAIEYCKSGSPDLAMIQLKKILSTNPKLVKAYQLLALIYIKEGRYNDARKQLLEANKIDNNNTTTLIYLQEVKSELKDGFYKHKKKKAETVGYTDGDRAILMQDGVRSLMDGTRAGIVNVLLGLAMGLLICFFLVVPSVKQSLGESESATLLENGQNLTRAENEIADLKDELAKTQNKLDKYTGSKDLVSSYEILIKAIDQLDRGDRDSAKDNAQAIDRSLLDEEGQKIYDEIMEELTPDICKELFDEGKAYYEAQNYESAITNFKSIIEIDEDYEKGYAMYLLADSLRVSSKTADSVDYYKKVAERFPNTTWGKSAAQYATVVN